MGRRGVGEWVERGIVRREVRGAVWARGGGLRFYLQQSFLRMNMALNSRKKKLPMEVALVCMGGDIIDNGADRSQLFRFFITDFDVKFFFQGHKGLDHVEGIESKVVGEGGVGGEGGCFNS